MADNRNSIPIPRVLAMIAWFVLAALGGAKDPSDNRYTNPVGGDLRMGDPFIFLEDGRHYLFGTTSTGEGFKCWSSTDLAQWEPHGFAYRKTDSSWGGKTFWAPEVFKYQDRYYMIYSSQPEDSEEFSARICLAVSDHAKGPYRDLHAPLFDDGFSSIDGHVFIDQGNAPYLYFARVGVIQENGRRFLSGKVFAARLLADMSGLASEPALCLEADQPWELLPEGRSRCNEGAYVFRKGDTYYMTYSANHYLEPEYGIGYATSESPLGPWNKSLQNPLVSGDIEKGVSGPGHNCVIVSPDGTERFMVYHMHANPQQPSSERTVNMDRLVIEPQGALQLVGPTRSPQPLPSRK